MVGFGCGMRFYKEDNNEKENVYFDRTIVMIPIGNYDHVQAVELNQGMFYNKELEKETTNKTVV